MSKNPGKDEKATDKTKQLGVKGDAFRKLTDKEADKVGGGRPKAGRATENPSNSDGCCGG